MAERDIPAELVNEILDDLANMSGLVLFRVKIEWSDNGRTGSTSHIVEAMDAVQAINRAWCVEDARHIRDVSVEWLTPIECVLKESEDNDDT